MAEHTFGPEEEDSPVIQDDRRQLTEMLDPGQWTSELLEYSMDQDLASGDEATSDAGLSSGEPEPLPQSMEQAQKTDADSTSTCLKMLVGSGEEKLLSERQVVPRILLTRKQAEAIEGYNDASHTTRERTNGVILPVEHPTNSRPGMHAETAVASPIPVECVTEAPRVLNERLTTLPLRTNDSREIQGYLRRLLDAPLALAECQSQAERAEGRHSRAQMPPNDESCERNDQRDARRRMREREYRAKRRAKDRREKEELIHLRRRLEVLQREKAGLEEEYAKLVAKAANLEVLGNQLAELVKTQKVHISLNRIRDQNQRQSQ